MSGGNPGSGDGLMMILKYSPVSLVTVLLLTFSPSAAFAQQPADTLQTRGDSLANLPGAVSVAKADTGIQTQSPSGIDSVVSYSATDSIVYSLSGRMMYLFGNGEIKYKELGLKAEPDGTIRYDAIPLRLENLLKIIELSERMAAVAA